jgi:pimeloyl-ACP methyl ester carboxylesterase
MWKKLAALAAVVVIGAGGAALGIRTKAEAHNLVTNPIESRRLPDRRPIDFGMVYDEVSATTADGLKLAGWYVPGRSRALVITVHGYKGNRGEMLNKAALLARQGFGVLLTSLRAHDLSDGSLITFGRQEIGDLEAWYRVALEQEEVDPDRIGLLGNSLGGTLAIEFAARTAGIRAVATDSAFSSLTDTIEKSVRFFTGLPPFPFAPLIAFWAEREADIDIANVDATRWIAGISPRPVLLMQGGADVVISTTSGQRLYDAARDPRELWFEPKVGHTGFDRAFPDEFGRRVGAFFAKHLNE